MTIQPKQIHELRVVKLGGSLLDMPQLREKFRHWLSLQRPARNLVVVGGGRIVDALREVDRLHGLGDEAAHWLAVRAMSLNARLAVAMFDEAQLVAHFDEWPVLPMRDERAPFWILDPWDTMQATECSANLMPHSWDVTSDSIAARIAVEARAHELVLLKSTLPQADNPSTAAKTGYVDKYFPHALQGISVRCVNLRDESFPEWSWLGRTGE